MVKRLARSWATTAVAAALSLFPPGRGAEASPTYPELVRDTLALGATPTCLLCHDSLQGGAGTVVTPFGRSMQGFGLVREDPGSLAQALATMRARHEDSDGDGIPDLDELALGGDPNDGPGRGAGDEPLQHGCASTPLRDPRVLDASLCALGAALVLASRRRRRA